MTIRTKILAGYLSIALLSFVLSYFSYRHLSRLQSGIDANESFSHRLKQVNTVVNKVWETRFFVERYLHLHQVEDQQIADQKFEELFQLLARLNANESDQTVIDRLNRIHRLMRPYRKKFQNLGIRIGAIEKQVQQFNMDIQNVYSLSTKLSVPGQALLFLEMDLQPAQQQIYDFAVNGIQLIYNPDELQSRMLVLSIEHLIDRLGVLADQTKSLRSLSGELVQLANGLDDGLDDFSTIIATKKKINEEIDTAVIPIAPRITAIADEISESHWQQEFEINRQMTTTINSHLVFAFSVSGVTLVVSIMLSLVFSSRLTRPIISLKASALELSKGNLDQTIETGSSDELGSLARSFVNMRNAIRGKIEELKTLNNSLEQKVGERTQKLSIALAGVRQANRQILDSIEYARRIQSSLLPRQDQLENRLPEHFVIWSPRDIVGGDLYLMSYFDAGFIISVIDCTGHGVPGALMTMLASSSLKRTIEVDGIRDPAEILKRLNAFIKTSLQQDSNSTLSDDGLDAAICYFRTDSGRMIYAGARIPLVVIRSGEAVVLKGDRQSIGYKRSACDFKYTNHELYLEAGASCFLYTDGLTDQPGDVNRFSFGSKRLIRLLTENSHLALDQQRDMLLNELAAHQGENERVDDVTVVAFKPHGYQSTVQF